jgi:hypothetical protein
MGLPKVSQTRSTIARGENTRSGSTTRRFPWINIVSIGLSQRLFLGNKQLRIACDKMQPDRFLPGHLRADPAHQQAVANQGLGIRIPSHQSLLHQPHQAVGFSPAIHVGLFQMALSGFIFATQRPIRVPLTSSISRPRRFFTTVLRVWAGDPMFRPGPFHAHPRQGGPDGFPTDPRLGQLLLKADFGSQFTGPQAAW